MLSIVVASLLMSAAAEPKKPGVLWTFPVKSHSFGSAAYAVIDNEPVVAFATYFGDASVHVLRAKDGKELWSYHDPDLKRDDCYDASLKFADMNGDGKLDLIVPCSSGCRVLCFEAATGHIQWNTYLGDGECIDTPPWIGDCDGSGKASIVVGTFKSRLYVLRGSDGSIARSLTVAEGGAVQSCPVVVDLNYDGVSDFVATIFSRDKKQCGVYAVNGKDGSRMWRLPVGDSIYHGPAIGTLPGPNGKPGTRLVTTCYDGHIRAINMEGSSRWDVVSGERYIMSPVTLAMLEGDITPAVITACEQIVVIDGGGEVRWRKPVAPKGRAYESVSRGVAVADMDGDGVPDLAYLTSHGLFRVLSAKGEVIYEFDAGSLLGEGHTASDCSHGPILVDLDGDGRLDAFFVIGGGGEALAGGKHAERYGLAVALTGFGGKATPTNAWTMMRHDLGNTGNTATPVK